MKRFILVTLLLMTLQAAAFADERHDAYGGWTGIQAEATGFFRLRKKDGVWWFFTPAGNAYIATGVNHIFWGLVNHQAWNEGLGRRKYGGREQWAKRTVEDNKAWGFTGLGWGDDIFEDGRFAYPYVVNLQIMGEKSTRAGGGKWDPFSEDFVRHCDRRARNKCAKRREDSWLIGYYLCDQPLWGDYWYPSKALNWVQWLQSQPAEAACKQRFVALLKERYSRDLDALNAVYGTAFDDWREVLERRGFGRIEAVDGKRAAEDDRAFLRMMAEAYYRTIHGAIRTYDANHLILGDRMVQVPPNNSDLEVLQIARRYVDCFSVHAYGTLAENRELLDKLNGVGDMPVMIIDFCYAVPSRAMPAPLGVRVETQRERGRGYDDYSRAACGLPYLVGWNWCGYYDDNRMHTGLRTTRDEPYTDCLEEMAKTHARLYQMRVQALRAE